jgi:hypothetical protein
VYHLLPYSFFHWCVTTPLGRTVAKSTWDFAILETLHIIGLTLLLGTVFVVNLTVLGVGVRQGAGRVARELAPWGWAGFALMLLSGVPMFMSSAESYSVSVPFAVKMSLLASAILLQVAMHKLPGMYEGRALGKVAACLSLLCWFGVAYAGRAIAFVNLFGSS